MIDFHLIIASTADLASVTRPVLAYLDPGTGSYALQILLATLFGGLFALKQSWSMVMNRFAATMAARRCEAATTNARSEIHGQSTAEIR